MGQLPDMSHLQGAIKSRNASAPSGSAYADGEALGATLRVQKLPESEVMLAQEAGNVSEQTP